MKKWIPVSVATAMALSTFAVSDAQAAEKYKLKSKKLVHVKTGQTVADKVVYKNRLYVNGSLAKGTVLHNKTLYVGGKITSSIVLYKGTFYKKGQKVTAKTKFVYKDKLYAGQKLATGYVTMTDIFEGKSLFYNGKRFTGIYKSVPYEDGYNLTHTNVNEFLGSLYKPDGSQIIYSMNLEDVKLTSDVKDIQAIVTNDPTVTTTVQKKDGRILITLNNTKKTDAVYQLAISGIQIKNVGSWSYKATIKSPTSKLTKMEGYTKLNNAFWTYKDYTQAQLKKLPKSVVRPLAIYSIEYGMNGGYIGSSIDIANYDSLMLEINRLFGDLFSPYMDMEF